MNPTLATIKALHTNHGRFGDREVTEEDLTTVLASATRAANSSARQAYSVVVLDDRDRMESLTGYRASRGLVFCVDLHRTELLAARLGRTFDDSNVVGFITAAMDTSFAAQTAVIAASSLGISSMLTNGLHRNDLDSAYRELGLPRRSVFPLIAVMLGYPRDQAEPAPPRGRLPLDAVVHRGAYREPDEAGLDRLIELYDDPDLRLGIGGIWDPDVHQHYLDWFFTQWCGEPDPDRAPHGKVKEVQDLLVTSGFWWPQQ